MTGPIPIKTPAGYAPGIALGFTGSDDLLALVSSERPLPVSFPADQPLQIQTGPVPIPADPVSGTTSADGLFGPYTPTAELPVVLTLSGTWEGTVGLRRSTDGGASVHPVTAGGAPWGVFSGNACEAVWVETEAGASLYLDATIASGTLTWRFAQ